MKLKFRVYLMLTLVYVVLAASSLVLFYYVTPQKYFGYYWFIDVFFWLAGITLTWFLSRCKAQTSEGIFKTFMLFRLIKFFCIIILLLVGLNALKLDQMPFAISLMCNYLIYSGMELYIYFRFNKIIAHQ